MRLRTPFSGLAPSERTRFWYMLVGFMCVASAALVARSAGDALFLSRYSLDLLSYMYVGTALVVIIASYAYGAFTGRIPIGRLIGRTVGVLIALLLALRIALVSSWDGFRIVAYLLSDLVVNVPMMLFWSFAALIFNPREAKRLFGFVGAGGTFACILVGFLVRPFAAALGTPNLLLLVALLIGGFLAAVAHLSRLESARLHSVAPVAPKGRAAPPAANYAGLLKTQQVRNLVLLILAATFTLTLVDYQFKAGARLHYSDAELAGFFGAFYASASIVAILLQLFLVHRILQKGGVLLGLAVLPAGLLLASAGTALTSGFNWIIATKFIVQIFLFTIDVAALQMLFLGIPPQSRNKARAFVEGIGKPAAMAATGLALAGVSGLLPLHLLDVGEAAAVLIRILATGAAAGAVVWLVIAGRNHRAYVSALVDSLDAYRFDPSQETTQFQDKTFEAHLREALHTVSDEDVVYLLGILSEMDHVDWTPEFRVLLDRQAPAVKIASLQYLGERGSEEDLPAFLAHRNHSDPEVRAAAIYAATARGRQNAVEDIEQNLKDPHPTVRAAAVAGLINSGDLDNLLNAGVVLKEMLASQSAPDRAAAADALSHIQNEGLIRPLIGLIQDANRQVVRAALKACKNRPHPDLLPAIIPLLADPEVTGSAAETLLRFGPRALDHLIPYLELHRMEGAFTGADRVPDILARIGDLKALPALIKASAETSAPNVQAEAVRAYSRLLQTAPSVKPYLDDLNLVVERELAAARDQQRLLREVAVLEGTEILCDALRQAYYSRLHNVFTLLDVSTPGVDMQTVYHSVTTETGGSRANALEVLDNVLKGNLKTDLLALLEPSARARSGNREIAAARVVSLLKAGASDWVAIGALYAVGIGRLESGRTHIHPHLRHPNPIVRETALFALGAFERSETLRAACARLIDDPDPAVSRLARELSVG